MGAEFAQLPGTHVVRAPEEITNVIERISPAAPWSVVPAVGELTALYTNFMLGPRAGPDVCATCFNFTAGTSDAMRAPTTSRGSTPSRRSPTASHASSFTMRSRSYKRLSGEVARRLTVELAAVLWRYIAQHEPCLATAAGVERFELVDHGAVRRAVARRAPSATPDRRRARRPNTGTATSDSSSAPMRTSPPANSARRSSCRPNTGCTGSRCC